MKEHIRTIGIDDAAFCRDKSKKTFVFGVIIRGNDIIEGILRTEVTVDGLDATEKIAEMIKKSKFKSQLKVIFLASSTIAAFNIIDLVELASGTKIPVITVLKKKPNVPMVKEALSHLQDGELRFRILMKNPEFETVRFYKNTRLCHLHIQRINIDYENCVKIIKATTKTGCIPEPLRIADMIGRTFSNYILN